MLGMGVSGVVVVFGSVFPVFVKTFLGRSFCSAVACLDFLDEFPCVSGGDQWALEEDVLVPLVLCCAHDSLESASRFLQVLRMLFSLFG